MLIKKIKKINNIINYNYNKIHTHNKPLKFHKVNFSMNNPIIY